jgi:hypothetical protein
MAVQTDDYGPGGPHNQLARAALKKLGLAVLGSGEDQAVHENAVLAETGLRTITHGGWVSPPKAQVTWYVGSWRWRESNPRPSISARKHLRAQPAIWISEVPRAPARSATPSPVSVLPGTRTLPGSEPASDARPGIAGVSRLTATYF